MSILNRDLTNGDLLARFPGYFKEMLNPELNNPQREMDAATECASRHLSSFIENVIQAYFKLGGKSMDNASFAMLESAAARFVGSLSHTLAKAPDKILIATAGFLWSSIWKDLENDAFKIGDTRLVELSTLSVSAINNTIVAMVKASKA